MLRKFAFDNKDLSSDDYDAEQGEEQRLEVLTKELAKVAKRQMSIIDTMDDQRNILLAVAAKAGVDTREEDTRSSYRL